MALPFTPDQFLSVLEQYNQTVFPAQLVFIALAFLTLFFVFKKQDRFVSGILALLWAWIGAVYHLLFFTTINVAAYGFGALFIIQAIIFSVAGFFRKLSFSWRKDWYGYTGMFFVLYALIIYPITNILSGHSWPGMPTFGLPCPTTIFTFGLLLLTDKKVPWYVIIIPLLWSLIGVSAAINIGIWEDAVLVIAGVLGTVLLWWRDR